MYACPDAYFRYAFSMDWLEIIYYYKSDALAMG